MCDYLCSYSVTVAMDYHTDQATSIVNRSMSAASLQVSEIALTCLADLSIDIDTKAHIMEGKRTAL